MFIRSSILARSLPQRYGRMRIQARIGGMRIVDGLIVNREFRSLQFLRLLKL